MVSETWDMVSGRTGHGAHGTWSLTFHRYGRSWNGKPRPVIANCFLLAVRDSIMQNAKKLAGTGIFINEDLPEDARLCRPTER